MEFSRQEYWSGLPLSSPGDPAFPAHLRRRPVSRGPTKPQPLWALGREDRLRVPLRGEGSCGGGGAPRDSAGSGYRFQLHIADLAIESMKVDEETQKELKEGQGQSLDHC